MNLTAAGRGGGTTRRQPAWGARRSVMGFMDKIRNKLQMGRGRVRQDAGRAMGDPYLESQGQADRVAGSAKQVGEQAKDAGKNIKDAFGH
jgi:uncharacterized protein YjbJ (UPF0337 family)